MSPAPTTATRFQLMTGSNSRDIFFLRSGLESVDGNAALVRVLAQYQLDAPADLDVGAVADRLQHEAGAVVHVEHRDRQGCDERCRHRLVDDERVHRAAARQGNGLELWAAAIHAVRM